MSWLFRVFGWAYAFVLACLGMTEILLADLGRHWSGLWGAPAISGLALFGTAVFAVQQFRARGGPAPVGRARWRAAAAMAAVAVGVQGALVLAIVPLYPEALRDDLARLVASAFGTSLALGCWVVYTFVIRLALPLGAYLARPSA